MKSVRVLFIIIIIIIIIIIVVVVVVVAVVVVVVVIIIIIIILFAYPTGCLFSVVVFVLFCASFQVGGCALHLSLVVLFVFR